MQWLISKVVRTLRSLASVHPSLSYRRRTFLLREQSKKKESQLGERRETNRVPREGDAKRRILLFLD